MDPVQNNDKSKEVFLPWLINRKNQIFLAFVSLFMITLLINQGGGSDLNKASIWVFRGAALLAFLFFYLLEYSRQSIKGLPLPSARQSIFKWGSYCLLAFLVINVVMAPAFQPALAEAMSLVMILAVMLLVSYYADNKYYINLIFYLITALSIFTAGYGLILYIITGAASPLSSFFAWHNPAGGYLATSLMLFIALFFTNQPSKPSGIYGWVGALILSTSLVFTLSRGAWLSMIAAVLLLLLLLGIRKTFNRTSSIIAFLIVVVAVVALMSIGGKPFFEPVYNRLISFTATKDFSIEGRENFYSASLEIFNHNPTTGSGLGSFGYIYPKYQTDPRHYARDPHSFYFRLLAEGGIPGIILILVIFWGYYHLLKKLLKSKDHESYGIGAGLVAALTAGLIHLAIDFDDTFPFILLNLGIIWIIGTNLFDPVQKKDPDPENKKSTLIVATIKGSSLLLVLLLFLGVYHCWRLYNSYSYSQMGDRFIKQQKWSDADLAFNNALSHYPSNVDALVERPRNLLFLYANAMMLGDSGLHDMELFLLESISAAEFAKQRAGFSARAHHVSGKANFQSVLPEHLLQSITDFEAALERDPMNSPRYHFDTAFAYWNVFGPDNKEYMDKLRITIDNFKITYPYDRVEEFARTRMEWIESLPVAWQDILLLEANCFLSKGNKEMAVQNYEIAENLEAVRKKIIDETPENMKTQLGIGEFESRNRFFEQFYDSFLKSDN